MKDTSRLIVWLLGANALSSIALVGAISLRHGTVPGSLEHIAVGAVSALAGGMVVKAAAGSGDPQ